MTDPVSELKLNLTQKYVGRPPPWWALLRRFRKWRRERSLRKWKVEEGEMVDCTDYDSLAKELVRDVIEEMNMPFEQEGDR